jgi:hypothetical protein
MRIAKCGIAGGGLHIDPRASPAQYKGLTVARIIHPARRTVMAIAYGRAAPIRATAKYLLRRVRAENDSIDQSVATAAAVRGSNGRRQHRCNCWRSNPVVDTVRKRAVVGGWIVESGVDPDWYLLPFHPRTLTPPSSLSRTRHACGVVRNVCCDVSALSGAVAEVSAAPPPNPAIACTS